MKPEEVTYQGDIWSDTLKRLKSELVYKNSIRHNLASKQQLTYDDAIKKVLLDFEVEDLRNRLKEVENNLLAYQAAYEVAYRYNEIVEGSKVSITETKTIFSTTHLDINNYHQLSTGEPEAISLKKDIKNALDVYEPYEILGIKTIRISDYL